MIPWFQWFQWFRWFTAVLLVALVSVLGGCDPSPTERVPTTRSTPSTTETPGRCEHHVAEGLCPKCNPALVAVYQAKGDWCDEHGFPESFCPICDPSTSFPEVGPLPAAPTDWCLEHGLPESKCSKCDDSLVEQYQASGDWCEEHGFPESVCPVCNPQPAPAGAEQAAIEARIVRFQSPEIELAAGIETATATLVETSPNVIECTARLAFDADRTADIRAIVPGIVRDVHAKIGDRVEPEAPLFELESPSVGETRAALRAARERVRTATAAVMRQRELRTTGAASDRQVELAEQELAAAEAEVSSASGSLRIVGATSSKRSGRFTLSSPIAGVVIHRPAVLGTLANQDTSLATITDTSVMWALCDVPETSAAKLELGQRLHLTVDGDPGSGFAGEVTWIAAEVDPRTRTVTARAELANPNGKLRANQFARARIETSAPAGSVAVPRAAVQRVGQLELVFVRTAVGIYEPRVVTRHGSDATVSIVGRVVEGDAVVTTGAILLRTEILPGSIGAGCCTVEPGED